MFSISCDFSIGFWNCSDNVVLFVFHFIIKQIHLLYFCIVNYEKFEDAKKGFSEAINRMTDNTMAKSKGTKGTGFLSFVYICIAIGDPGIKDGGLEFH